MDRLKKSSALIFRHPALACDVLFNALCRRAVSMALCCRSFWLHPHPLEENNQYTTKMKLALVSLFVGSAAAFSAVSFSP